jgi:hypothetical protein
VGPVSNYVPPPKPPYAQNPLAGVENYPDLDLTKMDAEHAAAHAVSCDACLAPALRRCTVGQYTYVPIHNPHDGRIIKGLRVLAELREKINREDDQ